MASTPEENLRTVKKIHWKMIGQKFGDICETLLWSGDWQKCVLRGLGLNKKRKKKIGPF